MAKHYYVFLNSQATEEFQMHPFLKHFLTFEQSAILKSKTFNETTYSFVELEALWNDKGDDEKQNYVPLQIPLFSITSVVYGKDDDKTIGFLIDS